VIGTPPFLVAVPRALLHVRYGGSTRTMIQKIKKQHNPSAIGLNRRKLIFPILDQNPDLPSKPGAPGYIYSSREDILGHSFSLFVRCTTSKKAVWRYFGEYKIERCGVMSTQKFLLLSDKVSVSWGLRRNAMTYLGPGTKLLGQGHIEGKIESKNGIYCYASQDRHAQGWINAIRKPGQSARKPGDEDGEDGGGT